MMIKMNMMIKIYKDVVVAVGAGSGDDRDDPDISCTIMARRSHLKHHRNHLDQGDVVGAFWRLCDW